jgi:hypothetical protein
LRFTVRRPASAEVSPCCHRPSGGDVARGVDVGIARPRVAGDALENRLALTVFQRHMPAVGASLRRIRCRDEFQPSAGLVLQPGHQQSPPLAADLAVETPFLRDPGARMLGEVPQRLRLHRLRSGFQPVVFGSSRGQLGTLLVVPGRMATWLPVSLLFDGKIPHKPGMATVLDQHRRLLNIGEQPKPAHSNNLGSTTDNQIRREAALPPRPKPGVSTPQKV